MAPVWQKLKAVSKGPCIAQSADLRQLRNGKLRGKAG
jgi:hypothetical protein